MRAARHLKALKISELGEPLGYGVMRSTTRQRSQILCHPAGAHYVFESVFSFVHARARFAHVSVPLRGHAVNTRPQCHQLVRLHRLINLSQIGSIKPTSSFLRV
jgi:hypothetical protein